MSQPPFQLPFLPTEGDFFPWGKFGALEHHALVELSRLDGMMRAYSKPELFWLMWLFQEARSSNVIEGTMTTFDEVLGEHAGVVVPAQRRDDVQEVLNYKEAMLDGIEDIVRGRFLTVSMVKGLHARLLDGARGRTKTPGELRTVQVHIGRPGSGIESATYVPPDPVFLQDLLQNLFAFIAREDLNPVVQTAVVHAQFEMIHPFLDGNGRMGRLLITLMLASKKILSSPCFYMSSYLQENRQEYYASLGRISRKGEWESWIRFFLEGVIEHCGKNTALLTQMTELYEKSKDDFKKSTNSAFSIDVLDFVFANPVFSLPGMRKALGAAVSAQLGTQLVAKLCQAGLVEKVVSGRGRRPSVYRFPRLLDILAD